MRAPENPFGRKLFLSLDRFGGTPGSYFGVRTGSGRAALVALIKKVSEDPARNLPACRAGLRHLAGLGYDKCLITYFDGSPLDAIFDKLETRRVALVNNMHGSLALSGAPAGEPKLTLTEVDYEDPQLSELYREHVRLGHDKMSAAAPELTFSTWCFDAFASNRKPLLAFSTDGRPIGAFLFWTEPSHYDPKTVLAFFCYGEAALSEGFLPELVGVARAHIAGLGSPHLICCYDSDNEPLKAAYSAHGLLPVDGIAGRFLCRQFPAAAAGGVAEPWS